MINTYQGESHRLLIEIKDGNGDVVDPQAGAIANIKVYVVHRASFEVVAKYAKVPASGYGAMTFAEEPDSGDYKCVCIMNSSQSTEAQQGMYEVQTDLYITDANFESGVRIYRQKGILMNLNPATNG